MKVDELVEALLLKPGYIKSGSKKVSKVFNVSKKVAFEAIQKAYRIKNNINPTKNKIFKRLFFDIETSPNIVLSWRTGYKINLDPENIIKERAIICICWKWENDEKVNYLTWDDKQDDKTMLEIFSQIIIEADEVIGHNGDRYDIPWIRTRCLYHRIPLLPDIKSLDTLKKVKSRFLLNSNKLDYIGKFLKVGEKQDTGGFDLWKKICLNNCNESLIKMVNYCKQDVVLLEQVYKEIENYIKHNSHIGSFETESVLSCPGCSSKEYNYIKKLAAPSGTISHQLQCSDCNKYYKLSNTNFKKLLNGNLQ